jgi:hypothetical protein
VKPEIDYPTKIASTEHQQYIVKKVLRQVPNSKDKNSLGTKKRARNVYPVITFFTSLV